MQGLRASWKAEKVLLRLSRAARLVSSIPCSSIRCILVRSRPIISVDSRSTKHLYWRQSRLQQSRKAQALMIWWLESRDWTKWGVQTATCCWSWLVSMMLRHSNTSSVISFEFRRREFCSSSPHVSTSNPVLVPRQFSIPPRLRTTSSAHCCRQLSEPLRQCRRGLSRLLSTPCSLHGCLRSRRKLARQARALITMRGVLSQSSLSSSGMSLSKYASWNAGLISSPTCSSSYRAAYLSLRQGLLSSDNAKSTDYLTYANSSASSMSREPTSTTPYLQRQSVLCWEYLLRVSAKHSLAALKVMRVASQQTSSITSLHSVISLASQISMPSSELSWTGWIQSPSTSTGMLLSTRTAASSICSLTSLFSGIDEYALTRKLQTSAQSARDQPAGLPSMSDNSPKSSGMSSGTLREWRARASESVLRESMSAVWAKARAGSRVPMSLWMRSIICMSIILIGRCAYKVIGYKIEPTYLSCSQSICLLFFQAVGYKEISEWAL